MASEALSNDICNVDLVAEGDNIVLDERGGEKLSFIKVKAEGKINIGKKMINMTALVGAPYGAMFMAASDGRSLQRMDSPIHEWDFVTKVDDTDRDNSTLVDANEINQKLGQAELEKLKQSGKSGAEIVQELCSNSATFSTKTEFSQDKYKKKKAKKYICWVTVRRPTARAICQAYYNKGPERVFNLRYDSLAIMLNMANVAAGARVLVFDNCVGVVACGVLERLGGHGQLCCSHVDRPYGNDAVRWMNLSETEAGVMRCASLANLLQAKAVKPKPNADVCSGKTGGQADASAAPDAATGGEPGDHAGSATVASAALTLSDAEAAPGDGQAGCSGATLPPQAAAPRKPGSQLTMANAPEELASLVHPGFTSLIVASPKLHLESLMQHVLPLLQPSATMVLFCPWQQPLAECLNQLRTSQQAAMLQLGESWMRPHQVLPMRTHPHMTCSGTGGYILSGIRLSGPVKTAALPDKVNPSVPAGASTAEPGRDAHGLKRGRDED